MKKLTVGQLIINLSVILFGLVCVAPIILVLVTSFASERSITISGYTFLPSEWSLEAYKMMFRPGSSIPRSYGITIMSTLIGTLIAVIITYGAGYTLANKNCKYRNVLALYFFVTMVFSAGLVPWYMVSKII